MSKPTYPKPYLKHPARGKMWSTWRFMGSYKWVISPLTGVIIVVALLKTPLITTHEPPSRP